MHRLITLLILILLISCNSTTNKTTDKKNIPEKDIERKQIVEDNLLDYVPEGYEIAFKKEADINLDSLTDIILICHNIDENDTIPETFNLPRPVIVLFGKDQNEFYLKGRNDNIRVTKEFDLISLGNTSLNGIAVKDNYFTIENEYGPKLNYVKEYYTFKVIDNDIFFHRFDEEVTEILEDNKPSVQKRTIRANEIDNVKFNNYKR